MIPYCPSLFSTTSQNVFPTESLYLTTSPKQISWTLLLPYPFSYALFPVLSPRTPYSLPVNPSTIICFVVITSALPCRLNILRRLSNRPNVAELRCRSHYLRLRASKSASLLGQFPLYLAPLNHRPQASRPRHVS